VNLARLLEAPPTFGYLLAAWLFLVPISIAASQILLAFTAIVWMYLIYRKAIVFPRLPLDWPILFYAAFTLAAAAFSFDPSTSLANSKKLLLFIVPYLVVSGARREKTADKLVLLLILSADVAALYGLWQYFFGNLGDLHHRIRGFMGHYMTFSGLLMGASTLVLARLIFFGRPWPFLAGSLALLYVTLTLTLTRNAWVGVLVAVALLLFLKNRRLVLALPVLVALAFVVVPPDVRSRIDSFFHPDTSGRDRLYMLEAAAAMVEHHPWLGVGLDMVKEVYPIYLVEGAPHVENIHLHNNLAQIAAERGLPCLLAWLWLMVQTLVSAARAYRSALPGSSERARAAGALAFFAASLTAGLFEYNFGDSEFLMLVLFVMALPFVKPQSEAA